MPSNSRTVICLDSSSAHLRRSTPHSHTRRSGTPHVRLVSTDATLLAPKILITPPLIDFHAGNPFLLPKDLPHSRGPNSVSSSVAREAWLRCLLRARRGSPYFTRDPMSPHKREQYLRTLLEERKMVTAKLTGTVPILRVSQNPAVRSTSITGGKTWPAADPVLKRSSSSPLVVAAQRDLTQTLPTKPSFATPVYTRDTDAWDTPPSRSYHSLSEPVAPSSLVTTVYNDTVSTGSHLRAFATLSAVSASHLSVPELAWPSQLPVYTPDYSQSHLYSSTLVTAVRVASSDANSLCNYDKVPDLNLGCIPSCDSGIFLTA